MVILIKQHISGEMIGDRDLISRVKLTCEEYVINLMTFNYEALKKLCLGIFRTKWSDWQCTSKKYLKLTVKSFLLFQNVFLSFLYIFIPRRLNEMKYNTLPATT